MNITEIINPILAIGGMGLLFGVGLSIAAKVFAVPVDERVDAVKECLPGANCGGCGFAGCDAFAKAVVSGEAGVGGCPVSSQQQKDSIAQVMGVTAEVGVAKTAIVHCLGTQGVAKDKYAYEGITTCEDAALIQGGPKGCKYGCLGFGSCVAACPFDAIEIVEGIAKVDEAKCKACGACVVACPRHLITINNAGENYQVMCMSHDKGKEVKANCTQGCIGCGICVKQCEVGAITLVNQVAVIDETKCVQCGKCAEKCPVKVIKK